MVKVCDFESYEDYYITVKEKKCQKAGYNMKVNEEIKSLNDIIMIRDYLKTKYNQNDTSLYTLSNKPYSGEVKYKAFLVMSDDNSKVIIVREGKVQDGDSGDKY